MAATHPYVRRFWTAGLGPGAVADLLRLVAAAHHRASIRHPLYLAGLVREDLVRHHGGRLWVRTSIPLLPSHLLRRLPPFLRAEHLRWATVSGTDLRRYH